MRGRLMGVLVALLLAGCAAPGARLDAATVPDVLDGITLDGATAERLPTGDLRLTLKGETARFERHEVAIPEGVTYVEAVITTAAGARFQTILVDKESGLAMCWPQRHQAWYTPVDGELRCTGLGLVSPGAWEAYVLPLNGANVVKPYTLMLTFSQQPLDGSAAILKLDQLSRPVHEALPTESFKVAAAKDGAKLHVEVTRPRTDAKVPIVLVASPYNTPERQAAGIANEALVKHLVPRGYAVATMDLRGTGISGGCYSLRGAVDQRDVADAVDWLGAQDWSNGKVGMYGISYEGFTPVAAAVQQPKHLATIYVGAPAIDMFANYRPGGVETGRTLGTGVLGYMVGHAAQTTDDPENPLGPVQYRADAACDPAVFLGNDPRMTYDAWWRERNLSEMADKVSVPVHVEQGFWDNPVKANAVADWFNLLTVEKRAVLGSWEHIWALRADQQLRFLAWMDHWLQGRDTGIMDTAVVEVLTNTRMHRADTEWPSTRATLVDVEVPAGAFASPNGAHRVATEPYADGLYVSGVPTLTFRATLPAGGNALLHAELFEVKADGERRMVIMGWLNAAHKDGHKTFAPYAPGESRDLELRLLPIDHVVQPGSTLELVVRSARTTDAYGTPEGALLSPPTLVRIDGGALHLPTLPLSELSVAPRSAS